MPYKTVGVFDVRIDKRTTARSNIRSCITDVIACWPISSTRTTPTSVSWNCQRETSLQRTWVVTSSRGHMPTAANCKSFPSSFTTRHRKVTFSKNSKTR